MQELAIRFGLGRILVGAVVLVMIGVGVQQGLAAFLAGVFVCYAALWLDQSGWV